MELEKNNYINSLFEFYEPLLTKKQANYIELYYADDYSLGEIAEEYNVSRQAVYDNIRRSEKSSKHTKISSTYTTALSIAMTSWTRSNHTSNKTTLKTKS